MSRLSRSNRKPLVRREADGHEHTASGWEALTERLIREAQEDGHFDDLPDHGQPLRGMDDHQAGDMSMAHYVLRRAGAAPPWIEADKEVRQAETRIEVLIERGGGASPLLADRLRRELDDLADRHDEAVRRLESLAPTPRQQRARLQRTTMQARLAAALDGGRVR